MVITCDTARSGEARGRSYPPAGLMLLSECREVAAKREGEREGEREREWRLRQREGVKKKKSALMHMNRQMSVLAFENGAQLCF